MSIDCRARTSVLVPLLRLILGSRKRGHRGADIASGVQWWPIFFQGERPQAEPIAAVVSTLGRGEAPAAYISSYWGAPAIHLGSPKRMTHHELTAVVAHQGHEPKPGEIALPIAPTRILKRSSGNIARNRVLLLTGGDAEGVAYGDGFWRALVVHATAFARDRGLELVIVTSPRTGTAEGVIEACASELGLPPESLAFYGRRTKWAYPELLYAATVVFATAESVSMISDAIAAGAKVVAVHPGQLPRSDRIRSFIAQQSACRRIALLNVSQPGPFEEIGPIEHLEGCWSDVLWEKVGPLFASTR